MTSSRSVGRRALIAVAVLAAASLGVTPALYAAGTERSDVVVITSVGIQFEKPRGWFAVDGASAVEGMERAHQASGWQPAHPRFDVPKLTFAKYGPDHATMNPVLTVYEVLARHDPRRYLELAARRISQVEGFALIEPPRSLRIARYDAAFARMSYPASGLKVESRAVAIAGRSATVAIGLTAAAEGPDRCEAEFQRLLRSIEPLLRTNRPKRDGR